MVNGRAGKRAYVEMLDGSDGDAEKVYKFQILLPDGTITWLTLHNPGEVMSIREFIDSIRTEVERTGNLSSNGSRRKVLWNGNIHLENVQDNNEIKSTISFSRFRTNKCYLLRLHDGAEHSVETFHHMWDLTPDTDLLKELPAEYTFETALADLIDNSLQAVWSNKVGERKLVSIAIEEQKIVIFDSGPGMDGTDENSISKWGKMGSSNHRPCRQIAIGGKPPYLMPFFGMFGYGGPIASMHLGRHAVVSSKTKMPKKVYTLHLSREALMKKSSDKYVWRADGGIRDPSDSEKQLSPHGSFTQVEICDLKFRCKEIFKLQCLLKDIYFPYIQCDEGRRIATPIEFQVNDCNLAEIEGGEVAITNLLSCHGPQFIVQLHLKVNADDSMPQASGSKNSRQANAQLTFVYYPIVEGKENIDRILEKLEVDGFGRGEDFEKFSRVSIRRLGRLLPDARWRTLPLMDKQKKGDKGQLLRRCCRRVKCFIDTDAGFSPTPSKTELAHHDPFTLALRSFGSTPPNEDSVAIIEMHKDGKLLNPVQLEKEYYDWIVQMHNKYDEELECGEDEPVLVIAPANKKKLGISADVVRVHQVIKRKGQLWESGQKIKILKGAVGCSKNNLYATLEYILLEGFQGDAGGEARIICRLIGLPKRKGCMLMVNEGNASLDIQDSVSFPISEIDSGKIQTIDDITWANQLDKKKEKAPSKIELLTYGQCGLLGVEGGMPLEHSVAAGYDPPDEIVAVIRPTSHTNSMSSGGLHQKYIVNEKNDMSMEVRYVSRSKDSQGGALIFGERVKPSSRNGFHGLYIFSLRNKKSKLFRKAGVYIFSFSVMCKDSSSRRSEVKVTVNPASTYGKWIIHDKEGPCDKSILIRMGTSVPYLSIASFDEYMNHITFFSLPEFNISVTTKELILFKVNKKVSLSTDQLLIEMKDMVIESGKLDIIRPSYKAALEISSLKGVVLTSVPCRVMPGPLTSIKLHCGAELEKHLKPGSVVEELTLELLDAFGNHIEEGTNFPVQVDGFIFQDNIGSNRKVNDRGFINLSGLLKVTADYGSRVHIFVRMDGKMIFEQMFSVVKRELRAVSEVPSYCLPGSHLKNVVFGVFDSGGVIDEGIDGYHHTLTLTSDSLKMDETIQYTFRNGRCTVPTVPVPGEHGSFSFSAFHTHYPYLRTKIEVYIMQDPKLELVPAEEPASMIYQPQHMDDGLLSLPYSSQSSPHQVNLLVETIMDDLKNLQEETKEAGLQVRQYEDKLTLLSKEEDWAGKEICSLQSRLGPQYVNYIESFVNTRQYILKQIEGKKNSAAAVFCKFSTSMQTTELQNYLMQDFVGVVALLGTVADSNCSSIFAEYLGENMLALVYKSYKGASALENYSENSALREAAATLQITITRRFPVICLEDMRPYRSNNRKDSQRKLSLPNPLLPSGKSPAGFLGYAVNMIDLDTPYISTRTAAGYDLRQTLFYQLFGETQVYQTREHMRQASICIKHGALSLDGGIMRANGIVLLGDHEPEVKFPVRLPLGEQGFSQELIGILQQIEERKAHLATITERINKESEAHSKALVKFQKKKDKLTRLLEKKSLANLLEYKQLKPN